MSSWFETTGVLQKVCLFLKEHTPQAYIVGGYLRDQLLGRESKDIDLLVSAKALPLGRQLADHLGGSFFPLDEERGVARIVFKVDGERYLIDLSQMHGPLEADLARRDFTINALATSLFDPESHLIDPHGGQHDLKERVVRALSEGAFQDDPLRLLRGVRLVGELGFQVESWTEKWMQRYASLITAVSPERLRDELCRILALEGSAASLHYLHGRGILTAVIPELQEPEHPLDTLERLESTLPAWREWPFFPHLLSHLRQSTAGDRNRLMVLKLTALLHHLGKADKHPPSEALNASSLGGVLRRLRFATLEVRLGPNIALGNPLAWRLTLKSPTPIHLYRFFRETKGAGVEALLLSLADRLATSKGDISSPEWQGHLANTKVILAQYFGEEEIFPCAMLTGNDLQRRFRLEPGPIIGRLLEMVREAQVEGRVSNREEALTLVEEILLREG